MSPLNDHYERNVHTPVTIIILLSFNTFSITDIL